MSDLEAAARELVRLKDERATLSLLIADAEARVADLLRHEPGGQATIDGLGTLKRHSGKRRKSWNHDIAFEDVVRAARGCHSCLVVNTDGEKESDAEHIARHIRKSAGIGYWRVGGLQELLLDADDYCESSWGPATVEVIQ